MHISSVIKISFCRISFSGHQNKFCACLDSIYGSRVILVMCKNCSDIRWHRLNSNQSKTNCPKNLNSDGLIIGEMGPWPECIFRSLLQFLVIFIFFGEWTFILPTCASFTDKAKPPNCLGQRSIIISILKNDMPIYVHFSTKYARSCHLLDCVTIYVIRFLWIDVSCTRML